jgi:multidrug efflux system membrane fusion protein
VFGGRGLIERGLTKGEQVVTDGYYRLQNGGRIEIEPTTPPPSAQSRSTEPG